MGARGMSVPAGAARLAPLDAVRGVVIILMTLDHASSAFNAGRLARDGAALNPPATMDALQFLVRWVTHVCAPAFVLLAGMALALSITRKIERGATAWEIDRDLLIRGGLLIAIDVVWMSPAWPWKLGVIIHNVLSAIGGSMIVMVALRRLPRVAVLALGIGLWFVAEALLDVIERTHVLTEILVTGERVGTHVIIYPLLPWLAFMALGWFLGGELAAGRLRTARPWVLLALAGAVAFLLVRGANGFGNFELLRADGSILQWLRVSKYPPSAAYAAMTLALVFAMLAAFWKLAPPRPLVVLGQAALFFYVLHVHLLKGAAVALGLHHGAGLGTTVIAWLVALAILYPLSVRYAALKQRRPDSFLRYL